MEKFCGSKFWDDNLTWYTNNPDFTPCFEKTVLAWVPCGFLWLTSGFELAVILTAKKSPIPDNKLALTKRIISLALALLQILDFGFSFRTSRSQDNEVPVVDHVTPAIKAATFALAWTLQNLDRRKGIGNSAILFLFWFIFAICEVFPFQTQLRSLPLPQGNVHALMNFIATVLSFPLLMVQFVLHFYADQPAIAPVKNAETNANGILTHGKSRKNEGIPCPEKTASCPSRVTFQWFWPLAYRGYKKSLDFTDLWNLNPEDETKTVIELFNRSWLRKLRQGIGKKKASILSSLWNINWTLMAAAVSFRIVQDLMVFVSPYLLNLLITHVGSDDEEPWKGYMYSALLFVAGTIQTLFMSLHYHKTLTAGMRIRTAIIGSVFRKSLLVSSAARKGSTLGEIVNLVSVDPQRFIDLSFFVNELWSAPFQIVLSVYFLWGTLGPSVLAGVGVMVILIPVNIFIQNMNKKIQMGQMKTKDERVKLMNEVLSGIKVLKLYAWEPSFEDQIAVIRNKEVRLLRAAARLNSIFLSIWAIAPFLVSLVTFGTFVLVDNNNVLDARKAFVSLTYFNIMRRPMSVLPYTLGFVVATSVSLKRINNFMNFPEIDPDNVTHEPDPTGDVITVQDGTFGWEETQILKNVNLRVSEGSLVAVVGPVGCGKTSLISAILGEMDKFSGRVNTVGAIAYVAQQAWMQNASLRDNILFGMPYDSVKYRKVLEACALMPDLKILPGGDRTEIGEKGINVSGGQKQRISLARAVYNDADIYLLDDPLSAVDSHVGKHLFEEVIGPKGLLRKKTRVFVTHGVTYLPKVDCIVVLNNGQVTEMGTYNELLQQKGAFAEFLEQHAGAEDNADSPGKSSQDSTGDQQRQRSPYSESDSVDISGRKLSVQSTLSRRSLRLAEDKRLERQQSIISSHSGKDTEKLISEEAVETGTVKADVYKHYAKAVSWPYAITSVAFLIAMQVCLNGSSVWLSKWSTDISNTTDSSKQNLYLGVYAAFGLAQGVTSLFGNGIMAFGFIRASQALHQRMLKRVLHAPMSFFDTTPLGRMLNRFAKDVDMADTWFALNVQYWFLFILQVTGTIVIISYSTPWFLIPLVPIGFIYYVVLRFYLASTRQLKRLESQSRSPLNSHFGETVSGAATIRAFRAQERFIEHSDQTNDLNQMSYYPSIIAQRWLTVRLETLSNLIIFLSALLAVVSGDGESSIGLSVSYALTITQLLNMLVRTTSEVETNIVSIERIKEYCEIVQEAPWKVDGRQPPPNWPTNGMIKFDEYQTRYREGLDLVLRGVSCTVMPGEKIGIVGRTGAGKSSLTLGLFRIIESAGGYIEIDGHKISELGLHDVRGKLTIIPQDPVLFSGSLRMNLDPFGKHSDDAVWRALEYAHLKSFVESLPSGLEHVVSEGGENLSVGQRQLVCLARALLWKTKVLILDEATAAVDLETDDLIQRTIRTEFADCTVLTIAHRLNTIMDSTRVMVLDKGMIKEFASPQDLLKDTDSIFYGMAKDAGLV